MTTIDVLIAILLLVVGGAGLLATELSVISAAARSRQLSAATCLAKAQMEALIYATAIPTSGGDTVDAMGCSSTRACVQQGTIFTRAWVVGAAVPTTLLVNVTFSDPAGYQHGVVIHGMR